MVTDVKTIKAKMIENTYHPQRCSDNLIKELSNRSSMDLKRSVRTTQLL